ncbi:hypothetical protein DPMN_154739 [Dreissena polymorpha]|uniref:Uncharacterized protein n=1 Tax=Dreissena polymorpha TaxID=45954 RepID=A0A9D4J9D9_DREPO|nr:hypothetical protein DPMN_154739 [Dreissena polymorpha]
MVKVKQDGEEQTSMTDAHWFPEEVPLLSIEKFCAAGVFLKCLVLGLFAPALRQF